jgi:hypothetical protein
MARSGGHVRWNGPSGAGHPAHSSVTDHVATLDRLLAGLPGADRPAFTAMLATVERNAGE